jgi:hypothetical protein
MNGKGSKPRPVDKQQYDKNFDRIFGKKNLSSVKQPDEHQDEGKRVNKTTKKL